MKYFGGIIFFLYYNGIRLVRRKLILKKCEIEEFELIFYLAFIFSFLVGFEVNYKLNKIIYKIV